MDVTSVERYIAAYLTLRVKLEAVTSVWAGITSLAQLKEESITDQTVSV